MRNCIRGNVFCLAGCLLAAMLAAACGSGPKPDDRASVRVSRIRPGMGTLVEVELTAPDSATGRAAAEKALDEMERLYALFDTAAGVPGGIGDINAHAGRQPVKAAPEVLEVLERARHFNEVTKGVFDITVKPLLDLWLAQGDTFAIPAPGILKATKSLVWAEGLKLRDDGVTLDNPLMALDPAGIAKGYILDRMGTVLRSAGIERARIRAGNDIRLAGRITDTWKVPVPHPRLAGTPVAVLTTGRGGVATASDAGSYFERFGIRYHHILDPRTGEPATASISVTVWAETAMDADALATGVFILGPDEGMRLVEELGNVEAVIYYQEEDRIMSAVSSGFAGKLK